MGLEILAQCDGCVKAVCVENVHVPGKWVSKAEVLRLLREANWTVGADVMCPECNGKGEPE